MSAPAFDENCDCIKKNDNQSGLRLQFYQEGLGQWYDGDKGAILRAFYGH